MARHALSASRGTDVIDFLAEFPDRAFTLSEISAAVGVNMASCHSLLATLVGCGYLIRFSQEKTYALGPALVAAGQAALSSQSLVARARRAAEKLFEELGRPLLINALINEDVVAVISITDAQGRDAGMRVGQRRRAFPPVGAPFLAWASPAEIEAWIERKNPQGTKTAQEWREFLASIRSRGYHLALRSPESSQIVAQLTEMALRRDVREYKEQAVRLTTEYDSLTPQPDKIVADELYDVSFIASPIFDRYGKVALNFSMGGFVEKISGDDIERYAEKLTRACLSVM